MVQETATSHAAESAPGKSARTRVGDVTSGGYSTGVSTGEYAAGEYAAGEYLKRDASVPDPARSRGSHTYMHTYTCMLACLHACTYTCPTRRGAEGHTMDAPSHPICILFACRPSSFHDGCTLASPPICILFACTQSMHWAWYMCGGQPARSQYIIIHACTCGTQARVVLLRLSSPLDLKPALSCSEV